MPPALIEARTGHIFSYQQLKDVTGKFIDLFAKNKTKQLFLIVAANRVSVIAAMQAAMQSGHAVLLCDHTSPPSYLHKLIACYQPEWILLPQDYAVDKNWGYQATTKLEGLTLFVHATAVPTIHADLALLLTTSGSTGSPKLVRLSHRTIATNTADIIEATGITESDRVAAHMPLAYSYGLSVVNTHLAAGACVALFEDGMTSNNFWKTMREHKVTTLPGVPYHFTLMQRLGLDRLNVPNVHTMLQAGGRMEPELVLQFASVLQQRNGQFFVMYGQTEAGPRMTTLPASRALDKPGSVGSALRHGKVSIENGEVVYSGPNVMMGYAENRNDLARGDDMHERLATGDLGYLDDEGFLFITGRKKRIAKIDGMRISLNEVEAIAASIAPTAVLEHGDQLVLLTTGKDEAVRQHVLASIAIHPSRVICRTIAELPRLANGKTDISALQKHLP